jgi:hypothetical protein
VGIYFVPTTNSRTPGDIKDHPDRHGEQGSGGGEVEVGVLMAEITHSLADTDCLNASQPTSPKWPKQPRSDRRRSGTRHGIRSGFRAALTQVKVKLLYLIFSF